MKRFSKILILFILALIGFNYNANATTSIITEIHIDKEINSSSWQIVRQGIKFANDSHANYILLHINTYGGTLIHADSIRTAILNCKIPTIAYINKNAASAGALISIACDSIYMAPGATIGAATVVNEKGNQMPDKYQSYMRGMIRATAEMHGKRYGNDSVWLRNPIIAESMVDSRIIVPGLIDSTKVLTLTANEAIKWGYNEAIVSSVDDIFTNHIKLKAYNITSYEPSIWDLLMGWLSNPALQAILIMIIIAGIYFELQSPGIGFPSAAAIVAGILYFLPLYLDGMAESWEIIVFVIGIILLIFEIFVIPGFGIAGILGVICVVGSMILALISNATFDFGYTTTDSIESGIIVVLSGILLGVVLIILLSHLIGKHKKGVLRSTALQLEQNVSDGYVGVPTELASYVGKTAVTATDLHPSGKIDIDGTQFDAVSAIGYIAAGVEVEVIKYENTQLYVK